MSEPSPSKIITLHDYQARVVADVCGRREDVLVEQPTGSGKTVEIVAIVSRLLEDGSSHALIAAPQEQIEDGFVRRDYDAIQFEGQALLAGPQRVRAARAGKASLRAIITYCASARPGYALVCTHAALYGLDLGRLPATLSGYLLIVDEAHHTPAPRLRTVVATWRQRGGRVLYFTATPYRSDRRAVQLDQMVLIRRSLAEHMQDGPGAYAPRYLETEIVGTGREDRPVSAAAFNGHENPPRDVQKELVERIVAQWEADGKPKTIVRVPPATGGSAHLVKALIRQFRSHHARVLDATGIGRRDKARFLHALHQERNRRPADCHDVIVGIQRVLEGTDWPCCSAVYCVGLPASLQIVVQLIGRTMRRKGSDYPAAFRDRSKITFFVPTAGGTALGQLSIDHSRHALFVSCFLADSAVGQEWLVGREVRRGIARALGNPASNQAAADVIRQAEQPIDPEVRGRVQLAAAQIYQQAKESDRPVTMERLRAALDRDPLVHDVDPAYRLRVLTEVLIQQEPDKVGSVIAKRLTSRLRAAAEPVPQVEPILSAVFSDVLEEFRDVTLVACPGLDATCRQLHQLTGERMEAFAARLRQAVSVPLAPGQVHDAIVDYYRENYRFPTCESGFIPEFGCSWRVLNATLCLGHRGLPGQSSLAAAVKEARKTLGMTIPDKGSLTLEMVHNAIHQTYNVTGKFPTRGSGDCPSLDMTFRSLNDCLRRGSRGLPGGSSLAREVQRVQESLEIEVVETQTLLTIRRVHRAIKEFFQENRQPPKTDSGYIPALKTTWKALNHSLRGGNRGLPRSSLHKEVAKVAKVLRQPLKKHFKPLFTLRQVHDAILAHHRRYGRYPTVESGRSAELDANWRTVNMALTQGLRGLPGKSSLSKEVTKVRDANPRTRGGK